MTIPQPPLVAASSESPKTAAGTFIPDRPGPSRIETRRVARCSRCDHMFRVYEEFIGSVDCEVCGAEVSIGEDQKTGRHQERPRFSPAPEPRFAPPPEPYGARRGLPRAPSYAPFPEPEPEVTARIPAGLSRGFGEVLATGAATFFRNFAGATAYSLTSNLVYYGAAIAVGIVLGIITAGVSISAGGRPSLSGLAFLFLAITGATMFMLSLYLALQAGVARISLAYLCRPGQGSWMDGFRELSQIGKAIQITFCLVPLGALIILAGMVPTLLTGSMPAAVIGFTGSAVILSWLALRYLPLLTNEMVFHNQLGALDTLRSHADLLKGNTLRLVGLVVVHIGLFFAISLPLNIITEAAKSGSGFGGALLAGAIGLAVTSIANAFFGLLYSASYLNFRYRRG